MNNNDDNSLVYYTLACKFVGLRNEPKESGVITQARMIASLYMLVHVSITVYIGCCERNSLPFCDENKLTSVLTRVELYEPKARYATTQVSIVPSLW